jgi:hypothetical protein
MNGGHFSCNHCFPPAERPNEHGNQSEMLAGIWKGNPSLHVGQLPVVVGLKRDLAGYGPEEG